MPGSKATGMSGKGNGGGWPSTTGNPSGGGRSNNTGGGASGKQGVLQTKK